MSKLIAAAALVLALATSPLAPAQAEMTQCTRIGDDFAYCIGGNSFTVCTRIGDTTFCY